MYELMKKTPFPILKLSKASHCLSFNLKFQTANFCLALWLSQEQILCGFIVKKSFILKIHSSSGWVLVTSGNKDLCFLLHWSSVTQSLDVEVSYMSEDRWCKGMRRTFSLSELMPLKLWEDKGLFGGSPGCAYPRWCQMHYLGDTSAHPSHAGWILQGKILFKHKSFLAYSFHSPCSF